MTLELRDKTLKRVGNDLSGEGHVLSKTERNERAMPDIMLENREEAEQKY